MGKQVRYDFTSDQEKALGELLCDNWGSNFQTSFDEDGDPRLYWQRGPQEKVHSAHIDRDGMVVFDG